MNRDRTGPEGKGPLTGRGMGPCSLGKPRETSEEDLRLGFGRGFRRGEGRRRLNRR